MANEADAVDGVPYAQVVNDNNASWKKYFLGCGALILVVVASSAATAAAISNNSSPNINPAPNPDGTPPPSAHPSINPEFTTTPTISPFSNTNHPTLRPTLRPSAMPTENTEPLAVMYATAGDPGGVSDLSSQYSFEIVSNGNNVIEPGTSVIGYDFNIRDASNNIVCTFPYQTDNRSGSNTHITKTQTPTEQEIDQCDANFDLTVEFIDHADSRESQIKFSVFAKGKVPHDLSNCLLAPLNEAGLFGQAGVISDSAAKHCVISGNTQSPSSICTNIEEHCVSTNSGRLLGS